MTDETRMKAFSRSLWSLSPSGTVRELLTDASLDRFKVYQTNLFYGVMERYESDLPGTFSFLGKKNFGFFITQFLDGLGIRSANISDSVAEFARYLVERSELQQPEFEPLTWIDLMWSRANPKEKELPLGSVAFWQAVVDSVSELPPIDFNSSERVFVDDENGEQVLRVKQD